MRPHPHLDPNLGTGRPYGLPLQAGEVAELSRPRSASNLTTACRIALEFVAAVVLVVGVIVYLAVSQ